MVTVLSLVMSITVFVALQSYLDLLSTAGTISEHLGDYAVVNLYDGFVPEELARMEADVNVSAVAAQQFLFISWTRSISLWELRRTFHWASESVFRFLAPTSTMRRSVFGKN